MIRDALSIFAVAGTSVAASAGTAAIGNIYDSTKGDGGPVSAFFDSEDLYVVVAVTTSIITGGSAGTVSFQFVSAATTTITSSPNLHDQTPAYVTGSTAAVGSGVAAGDRPMVQNVARGQGALPVYLRYLGILCVTATTTTTAGAITAYMTKSVGFWAALPEAVQ